jgi:hypothetical protein
MALIDDLKSELQGKEGLIQKLKDTTLPFPEPVMMIEGAQEEFEKLTYKIDDPDKALSRLLVLEFETYKKLQQEWLDGFWQHAKTTLEDSGKKYPVLKSIFSEDGDKSPISGSSIDSKQLLIGVILGQSMSQSGRTRAGFSLMEHISWLLSKHGFKLDVHFKREEQVDSVKLDFIFPNAQYYSKEPNSTVTCAAMTTMNDRYRLAIQQLRDGTFQRILTGIGSENYGKALGPGSLSKAKLNDVKKKGAKVVVLKSVKDAFSNNDPVMTYTEWFKELEKLKPFWSM